LAIVLLLVLALPFSCSGDPDVWVRPGEDSTVYFVPHTGALDRVELSPAATQRILEILSRPPEKGIQMKGAPNGQFEVDGELFDWYPGDLERSIRPGERWRWTDDVLLDLARAMDSHGNLTNDFVREALSLLERNDQE
jgi:hypothetical protein